MRIESLWDTAKGETCYVLGTGPSHRLLQPSFFEGKLTIGLNQAWKFFPCRYVLTIHPHETEVIPEGGFGPDGPTLVTKRKGEMGQWSNCIGWDDPHIVLFRNNKDVHDFMFCERRIPGGLYTGRGIQASAVTLAAHMGCATVVLCGCDMAEIADDHHGHDQHVRFHGLPPDDVYAEYYENTAAVRRIVQERFGTEVLSLSPFLGSKWADRDYARLAEERSLPALSAPQDTSGYERGRDRF